MSAVEESTVSTAVQDSSGEGPFQDGALDYNEMTAQAKGEPHVLEVRLHLLHIRPKSMLRTLQLPFPIGITSTKIYRIYKKTFLIRFRRSYPLSKRLFKSTECYNRI
jgi:hypothetical protein